MAQVRKFDLNQGPAAAAANYITQCVDVSTRRLTVEAIVVFSVYGYDAFQKTI